MTDNERFETALVRVQSGETIVSTINNLYVNKRRFRKLTTPQQRGRLSLARNEYLTNRPDPVLLRPPRLIAETTPELQRLIREHCRRHNLTFGQFINNAVRAALRRDRTHQ